MAVIAESAERQHAVKALPYTPSWIDHFTDWVRRLPIPAWLFYLTLGLVLSLARTTISWSDGTYPVGTLFPVHILDGLVPIILLLVLHYLDNMAERALAGFRPVLVKDADYDGLRYEITTMPARPVFAWTIFGTVFGLTYIPLMISEADRLASKYFTSPAATVADTSLSVLVAVMMAASVYHTIHQLRTVSRIYTRHTSVSIFDIGPLYTLSRVTAVTTVAWLFLTYMSFSIYGDVQAGAISVVVVVVFVVIALVTFVWPLYGAHRLLQNEKEHRKSDISRRIQAVSDELHRRADTGDYGSDTANINSVIDGLVKEQGVVEKASTWPWDPEAVRAVLTALLLPIVLWLITRILERLGL
jgi:hypothetical protein